MPRALINGVNIYYESHGSGFPLVFAYGLGGNTGEWAGQVGAFSKHYRFVIWDPRGHGKSDSPPERDQYGLQISADDLLGLLNHLGIEKVYLGGLSMGGVIGTLLTLAHPERVAALLIIDSASASGLPMPPAMRKMREKCIQLCENQGMDAVADYCIQVNPNFKTRVAAGPEGLEGIRRMFRALNPTGYINTIRVLMDESFPATRLSQITAPTLVLVGSEDPALEAAHLTHTSIPGSQYVVIPGAGHMSNQDRPEEFNTHILEYLQQIEAGVGA